MRSNLSANAALEEQRDWRRAIMKKIISLVLMLVCVLTLVGCQNTINGSDVYSFPEPTTLITGTLYSQGKEQAFVIGSEEYNPDDLSVMPLMEWFYGLELSPCEQPEDVEGGEHFDFSVNGEWGFSYQERGSDAYIIVSGTWYKVKNPAAPPIDAKNYETSE